MPSEERLREIADEHFGPTHYGRHELGLCENAMRQAIAERDAEVVAVLDAIGASHPPADLTDMEVAEKATCEVVRSFITGEGE